MTSPLLDVRDLNVEYATPGGSIAAVKDVSLAVFQGEAVGIVGESGSGKSTLAHSLLRLLPRTAGQRGQIVLDGVDLTTLSESEMRKVRGDQAAMVFQDPMRSFDPQRTIGYHLREGLEAHRPGMSRKERQAIAVQQLKSTELPEPEYQARRYPHELSGGMRQRAMLALALENSPVLLIADEPTTALDVTIQAQILRLFADRLSDELSAGALVLISHDLAVVRQVCSRIAVMYAGRIVEDAPTEQIFNDPRHPYTQALIRATPRAHTEGSRLWTIGGRPPDGASVDHCSFADRCTHALDRCRVEQPELIALSPAHRTACFLADEPLPVPSVEHGPGDAISPAADDAERPPGSIVELEDVGMTFQVHGLGSGVLRRAEVAAVREVSLTVDRAETLGIVGESGSGKSTLARIVLGLLAPTAGRVLVSGENPRSRKSLVRRRQKLQAVFQDPHGSLNPRMTVGEAIAEPLRNLRVSKADRVAKVTQLLDEVQLSASFIDRYPPELSGGQAQRVAIARALAPEPDLVVLDEPTSGLDISIQAHILNLLADLQARHHLTYILISHDLTIVRHLADRIAVMYFGRIVELGEAATTFNNPSHPYTAGLLAAVPDIDDPERPRPIVSGEPPSPISPPAGCAFHTRCPIAESTCRQVNPPLEIHSGQLVACHLAGQIAAPVNITPNQWEST